MTKAILSVVLAVIGATLPAQTAWTRVAPSPVPSPRSDLAMVADARRGVVVLSGGWNGRADLADTWVWDGTAWRDVTPPASANRGPHSSHRMVFDGARGVVVSFGGWNAGRPDDATWTWDGAGWTRLAPAIRPSARASHAMAYDVARDRVVLFGGYDGAGGLGDTWEFDGTTWLRRSPSTSPSPRFSAAMVFDPVCGRCLLFGGRTASGRSDELWEWDGSGDWRLLQTSVAPSARSTPAFAYDAARDRFVVFGGFDGRWLNDTWEWNGVAWERRAPTASPTGRGFAALAFDAPREQVVLFGGDGGSILGDQWSYAPTHPAGVSTAATGCGGLAVDLSRTTRPWLGETFALAVTGVARTTPQALLAIGSSATTWGGRSLPIDLAPFGMRGCSMRAAADDVLVAAASGGTATFSIRVPRAPSLLGAVAHAQAFALAPAANPTGVAVTERVDAVLGGK